MKISTFIYILLTFLIIGLSSCSKKCESSDTTCLEAPPTNEACLAFFTRWFYNEADNKCEQISYSGCSEKGFETEESCNACKCD